MFVGLGIVVALTAGEFFTMVWFIGLPLIFLVLQYLWLRLCRDPFLSQRYVGHGFGGYIIIQSQFSRS